MGHDLLAPLLWGPPTGGFIDKTLQRQFQRYKKSVVVSVALQQAKVYRLLADLGGNRRHQVHLSWLNDLYRLVSIEGQERAGYPLLQEFVYEYEAALGARTQSSLMKTMQNSKNPEIRAAALSVSWVKMTAGKWYPLRHISSTAD